jgi:chaperonin GroEL
VGGVTDTEIEAHKVLATRAVTGLRNAILGGVIPGGGAALLNAQSSLDGLPAKHEDEAIAYKILSRALEEPMRTIASNAGYQPDIVIEKVRSTPKGFGLDARSGQIVDLRKAGIFDSARVLKKALEIAVSGAAMALTTDVIIHHKKPKETLEP